MTRKILNLDGQKLAWHSERVKAWSRGEKIAPITIDMALTRACTYKCVYCYSQLQENKSMSLTQDVLFRFLDDAAEIGVKAISLVSDGESTCSPYLYDFVLRGKDNGLDMALGTNGYLLKQERLEELLPALTYLRFNMSSADPKRYCEIHGCDTQSWEKVIKNIDQCVKIKKKNNLDVTIGLQMVLLPQFADQIISLVFFARMVGVDYLIIKHCSDDEDGTLGVKYEAYQDKKLIEILKQAESMSTPDCQIAVKWSKILDSKRSYSRCYGPPFILQLSGSGLVAPCGMLFGEKYKKYHIGNIADTSFKELWKSERYWQVMEEIASPRFDAKTMCGCLCLQHKVNEYLDSVEQTGIVNVSGDYTAALPKHHNFI